MRPSIHVFYNQKLVSSMSLQILLETHMVERVMNVFKLSNAFHKINPLVNPNGFFLNQERSKQLILKYLFY